MPEGLVAGLRDSVGLRMNRDSRSSSADFFLKPGILRNFAICQRQIQFAGENKVTYHFADCRIAPKWSAEDSADTVVQWKIQLLSRVLQGREARTKT
jgi:hypothetical protein